MQLTMSNAGCGPATIANICNRSSKKKVSNPTALLSSYPSYTWDCGGSGYRENLDVLAEACGLDNQVEYDKSQGLGELGDYVNPEDSIFLGIKAGYQSANTGHFNALTNCHTSGNATECDLMDSKFQKVNELTGKPYEYTCTLRNNESLITCVEKTGSQPDITINAGNDSQFNGHVVIVGAET